MASYFTRAKARSDDTQPGDSASVAATTPALTSSSVEQHVELTGGSESMSIEVAGPMTTHPQQLPQGGHPPVGGHGVTGSADPLQVGVILGYPSKRADPLEREEASATDALAMADDVTKLPLGSSKQASPRQPPTVSDTTAAAFPSSTQVLNLGGRLQCPHVPVPIVPTPLKLTYLIVICEIRQFHLHFSHGVLLVHSLKICF